MIRRSTLAILACISALSPLAIPTNSAASPTVSTARTLLAQAASTGEVASFQPLGIGARGEAVSSLQRRLLATDYYSGPIDGLYGIETQRAIVALQRASGLEDTGTLNEATWKVLEAGGKSTTSVAGLPTSASVEGQMPLADASAADVPVAEKSAAEESAEPTAIAGESSKLSPILILGIGAIALIGSFGVGFYWANKDKRAKKLSEADLDAVGIGIEPEEPMLPAARNVPAVPANPALRPQTSLNSQLTTQSSRQHSRQTNVQLSYAASGSQSRPMNHQIGQTGPLSQMDVIEGLIGELHNPDPARRRKAIWELGQRGNSIAVQPLVDAMPHADSKEKSLLLAALSEIGIRSLRPMSRAMAIAFQDANSEVRKNAIRDLSRVYDIVVQISHMLGHATEDEDPEVRQTATWALDKLNTIRKNKDVDSSMRSFPGNGATPIDLLSSEASIRRSQEIR